MDKDEEIKSVHSKIIFFKFLKILEKIFLLNSSW